MQLPIFPEFKSIKELDQESIQKYIPDFPPYSDFNFSNNWSWNLDSSFKAADLNGNLVLFLRDMKTKEFFISIAGTNKINESLSTIFNTIDLSNISQTLALVPEETANLIDGGQFLIEEDRDYFDYVYSTEALVNLSGKEYKSKRHLINQFAHHHTDYQVVQKILTAETKLETLKFMSAENRKRSAYGHTPFVEYEMAALEHFFLLPKSEKIIVSLLYTEGELIGFTIDEMQFNDYVLSLFFKVSSDEKYRGAYDVLNMNTAKYFKERGYSFWNWAEDLGSAGLRKAKLSYRPVKMLKKYTISKLV